MKGSHPRSYPDGLDCTSMTAVLERQAALQEQSLQLQWQLINILKACQVDPPNAREKGIPAQSTRVDSGGYGGLHLEGVSDICKTPSRAWSITSFALWDEPMFGSSFKTIFAQ